MTIAKAKYLLTKFNNEVYRKWPHIGKLNKFLYKKKILEFY